ncbi:MAG: chromate transporter [Erysipelotrichaceae bacterium]|nr:chromate transporter [Erysipelotrichaceae bacterium]MDD3809673.1 chromate transporter [Erysipelotrichaceae bacterium]
MEYLYIYLNFCKIGLFTIGGGLAALPLLQDFVLKNGWLTLDQFANMIAISQATPGPLGINMATYIGFSQMGVRGSLIATLGMVTPSWVIIMIIARGMENFKDNRHVQLFFTGLRPVVIGIILAALFSIAKLSFFDFDGGGWSVDFKAVVLFGVLFGLSRRLRLHPSIYLIMAGLLGIMFF